MTCHSLAEGAAYLEADENRDPHTFVSSFEPMTVQSCTSCHAPEGASVDCLTCHAYHVRSDGVQLLAAPLVRSK